MFKGGRTRARKRDRQMIHENDVYQKCSTLLRNDVLCAAAAAFACYRNADLCRAVVFTITKYIDIYYISPKPEK